MVYTLTFNPALDFIMKVDNLSTDDINRTTSEEILYGGKGINVSAILRELDIDSVSLGFIAGFTGGELKRLMEEDGLKSDFVELDEGMTRINVKVRSDKELDINSGGPNIPQAKIDELFMKLDALKEGDYLILAGSVPSSIPDDIYSRIIEKVVSKGVKVAVDTTGDKLMNTLKYKPFLIKPNHHELGEIFGKTLKDTEEIIHYAKELQKLGAVNVIVSRGGDGSILVDENGCEYIAPAVPGKLVSSVGCGDSMVAGFIAGTLKKPGEYGDALKLATACGSATAFSIRLARKEEINAIYDSLKD